jgi:hypothetical protein
MTPYDEFRDLISVGDPKNGILRVWDLDDTPRKNWGFENKRPWT